MSNGTKIDIRIVGKYKKEITYKNGFIYKIMEYYNNNNEWELEEICYLDKEREKHNDFGPANIVFNQYNNLTYIYYYKHGYRHRDDGPAKIAINKDMKIVEEAYIKNGDLYNIGEGNYTELRRDTTELNVIYKSYVGNSYYQNQFNNFYYYKNGKLKSKAKVVVNKNWKTPMYHSEDGPAIVSYDQNNKEHKKYYINDINYNNEYEKYLNKITKHNISAVRDIDKLKIMRIVCKELNKSDLLDYVDSRLLIMQLTDQGVVS